MQRIDGRFIYAASDLNNYLECAYLSELDRLVALGEKVAPQKDDPQVELIARKGDEHERWYLGQLRERYEGGVTTFQRPQHSITGFEAAQAHMIAAMERGAALIYQGTFFDGQFLGHPDFLRRIEVPCERWEWSYEVIDTKLALSTKPYFIIQLCNYSEHLARIQGTMPEFGHIVLGNGEEKRYRLNDYSAYYRHLKKRFLAFVTDASAEGSVADTSADPCHAEVSKHSRGIEALYPHKCSHCQICKWSTACEAQRKDDDHLSLVARMRRDQIGKLNGKGVQTVIDLAAARDEHRPEGMNAHTFEALRRQATMQVRGRTEGPIYEILEHQPFEGFGLMPAPAEGDLFFDMEGDPLYEPGRSLEYLFGCWLPDDEPKFKAFWALDRAEEKRAFEAFVDFITERRRRYPDMHVYHYADYEKAALRRLAQMHGTREEEVDDLLRGEVLVDLYAVVRQSLVISEDSYSIKRLEKFYGFKRATEVRKGDDSIVMFETWLQARERRDILEDIERYNEDDCRSTLLLRDWLLERREEAIAQFGTDIPFHEPKLQCHAEPVDGCRKCTERIKAEREVKQTSELQRRLMEGVLAPQTEEEYALMTEDHRARYLLANLLAYHRREDKPVWWAFFDRCENVDNLLEFDKDAIAGLKFCDDVEVVKEAKSWLYTYTFPDQHYKLGVDDSVHDPDTGKSAGTIFALDDDRNRLTLKWTGTLEEARNIRALIPGGPIRTDEQRAAIARIAQAYVAGTLDGATLDILLARTPRIEPVNPRLANEIVQPEVVTPEAVSTIAKALENSYLFIQGPPGTGKTYTGSRVICDLLAAGKRVGVMSSGHKAIHNLLHKVEACAQERGVSFIGRYKFTKGNGTSEYVSQLAHPLIASYATHDRFESDDYQLAAGTAWLFAREAFAHTFDYILIDEAGQLSLADAIAVTACAKNIILLGDPLQLAQVSQGLHPLRVGASVLEHLLGDAQTVPENRGIFLDITYRMHPEICSFVSEMVYGGRLRVNDRAERQRASSAGLSGTGLRHIAIEHYGNSRESLEEAERIVAEVARLLNGTVTSDDGGCRAMLPHDIIVVTPYNAQQKLVSELLRAADINVRVGTVDKFQGQEAFVAFYSMASSTADDIPRDLGFAFERNRFNVAVSRARAMSALICSTRLLDAKCITADDMALTAAFCAFVEKAQEAVLSA